jgi:hypothetical protein
MRVSSGYWQRRWGELRSNFDSTLATHTYLAIGIVGKLGFVSQVVHTTPGQRYTFSFEFSSDGATGNAFQALWNGNTVMQLAGPPFNPGWANFDGSDIQSFTETAVSSSAAIAFGGMGTGSSYVGVDGVSVTSVNLVANSSFENDGINLGSLQTLISDWTLSDTPANMSAGETATRDPTLTGQTDQFSFSYSSDGDGANAFEALGNGNTVMQVAGTALNPDC